MTKREFLRRLKRAKKSALVGSPWFSSSAVVNALDTYGILELTVGRFDQKCGWGRLPWDVYYYLNTNNHLKAVLAVFDNSIAALEAELKNDRN